jgi:hypothetical protein
MNRLLQESGGIRGDAGCNYLLIDSDIRQRSNPRYGVKVSPRPGLERSTRREKALASAFLLMFDSDRRPNVAPINGRLLPYLQTTQEKVHAFAAP